MSPKQKEHILTIGNIEPESEVMTSCLDDYKLTQLDDTNAEQLITLLRTQTIDLVLINMPTELGLALLPPLIQANITIPFIFILHTHQADIIQQLFTYPQIDYCLTPLQASELSSKIKTQLTLSKLQTQMIQTEKLASLGRLVGGIAHEVNTPVGIGITIASHLMEDTKNLKTLFDDKKIKKSHMTDYISLAMESSELILNNLNRASALVLSFKTVSADQVSEERRLFSLPDYIDDILLSLKPKLKRAKHNITVKCEKSFDVDGYPGAFAQIITNLLMNALIHAFNNDTETIGNITISVDQQHDNIELRFSDDGNGIAQENLALIFEPFFTTKRNEGGTGLGLNIVKNVTTQTLHGDIRCESTLGKGTTFYLTFPLQIPE